MNAEVARHTSAIVDCKELIMLKRIGIFLLEAIVFLPISAVVTLGAWLPIIIFFTTIESEPMNLFIMIPLTILIGWGIAFGVNKFRMWLKGRQTEEFYDVDYHDVSYDVEESFWIKDYYTITETHTYGTRTESENTGWGWLGILSSFIALPCSIVSVLMSFFAIIMPAVYVTPWRVDEREVGRVNLVLHALFDFMIIPVHMRRTGRPSPLGLIFLPVFLALPLATFLGAEYLGDVLSTLVTIPEWVTVVGILVTMFLILALIVIIIEKSILLIIDFSKQRIIRTIILMLVLNVLLFACIMPLFLA